MEKIKGCVFCEAKLNKGEVIFETENFFVNLGVGLVAPGHIMLIPKRHYDCCADICKNLRPEFENLAKLIFGKIEIAFGAPFLVEYGVFGQSVAHAHLHFIPKKRNATTDYCAYEICDVFEAIKILDDIALRAASWEAAAAMKKHRGGYVFFKDGKRAVLFDRFEQGLSYRHFFNHQLMIKDIPTRWQDITAAQERIDAVKRRITKESLKF